MRVDANAVVRNWMLLAIPGSSYALKRVYSMMKDYNNYIFYFGRNFFFKELLL